MRKILLSVILLVFNSCSFDNKTGIWNNSSDIAVNNQISKSITNSSGTRYEDYFIKNKSYNEEKVSAIGNDFKIDEPINILNWPEQFAVSTNNVSNFSYNGDKLLLSKSFRLKNLSLDKSLTRKIIFYNNKLISYDQKGRIFVYSLNLKKITFKFNFYKKKFKNHKKEIYLLINKNILYAADNLGYLYALNLNNNTILWAKNYGIPFRSNLKFANAQLFLANQDNVIYSIDPKTGNKNWEFATSLTFLKSDFENNFALDPINKNIFFLNTSGELYSLSYTNQKINWIINFKNRSLAGDTDLFLSKAISVKNTNLIISLEKAILSFDVMTGARNWSFSAEPIFKPIITANYTYVVLKNNLLICLNNKDGKIVWSKNIFQLITNKKFKNKFESFIDFKIINSEISIFSRQGYLLTLNPKNGNLESLNRINKKGIASEIYFIDKNMFFVDKTNRLLKFN